MILKKRLTWLIDVRLVLVWPYIAVTRLNRVIYQQDYTFTVGTCFNTYRAK